MLFWKCFSVFLAWFSLIYHQIISNLDERVKVQAPERRKNVNMHDIKSKHIKGSKEYKKKYEIKHLNIISLARIICRIRSKPTKVTKLSGVDLFVK